MVYTGPPIGSSTSRWAPDSVYRLDDGVRSSQHHAVRHRQRLGACSTYGQPHMLTRMCLHCIAVLVASRAYSSRTAPPPAANAAAETGRLPFALPRYAASRARAASMPMIVPTDGPFTETKELIVGYASAGS